MSDLERLAAAYVKDVRDVRRAEKSLETAKRALEDAQERSRLAHKALATEIQMCRKPGLLVVQGVGRREATAISYLSDGTFEVREATYVPEGDR